MPARVRGLRPPCGMSSPSASAACTRAPAQGTWKEDTGEVDRDEVVMCEVMVDPLDRERWADYRKKLEQRFGLQELMMRALKTELL